MGNDARRTNKETAITSKTVKCKGTQQKEKAQERQPDTSLTTQLVEINQKIWANRKIQKVQGKGQTLWIKQDFPK